MTLERSFSASDPDGNLGLGGSQVGAGVWRLSVYVAWADVGICTVYIGLYGAGAELVGVGGQVVDTVTDIYIQINPYMLPVAVACGLCVGWEYIGGEVVSRRTWAPTLAWDWWAGVERRAIGFRCTVFRYSLPSAYHR